MKILPIVKMLAGASKLCGVPFVEDEEKVFLKTIVPSRKATKKYLVKGGDKK